MKIPASATRSSTNFPAADAYDHGAGHAPSRRALRCHRARPSDHAQTFRADPLPIAILFGNWCSRIVAPAGPHAACQPTASVSDSGLPDVDRAAAHASTPVEDLPDETLRLSARQPLLRDRPAVRHRLEPVRQDAAGLGARPGDLRLRASPHHVRLRARPRRPRRPGRPSTKARACAATTRISPSRSAAA